MTTPRQITRAQFNEALVLLGVDASKVKALHITYDTIIAEELAYWDGKPVVLDNQHATLPALIRVVP